MNNTPPTTFRNSVKAVNDYHLLSIPLLLKCRGILFSGTLDCTSISPEHCSFIKPLHGISCSMSADEFM